MQNARKSPVDLDQWATAGYREYVKAIVDKAPPLSAEQSARIGRLLKRPLKTERDA